MPLRDYMLEIAEIYDHTEGFEISSGVWVPGQDLVRNAETHVSDVPPIGYVIRSGAGQFPLNPTDIPWFGFLDPDETQTPTKGIYVPYILRADKSAWTVSVQFGVTHLGLHEARGLRAKLRDLIPVDVQAAWDAGIELRSQITTARKYEAATILARTYPLPDLPNEETLRQDLDALLDIYERLLRAKNIASINDPDFSALPRPQWGVATDFVWAPGQDQETEVTVTKTRRWRRPRHESGLASFGAWLKSHGHDPATSVHPMDFYIPESHTSGSTRWCTAATWWAHRVRHSPSSSTTRISRG